MENSYVTTLDLALSNQLLSDLIDQGFEISYPAHSFFSGKKPGISCTLYKSGKLLIQGKNMKSFIEFYLEPKILKNFDYNYQDLLIDESSRIGVDESGKGDFFGPLCIAGVHAQGKEIIELKKIGIKDSKKLSDVSIKKIAKELKNHFTYHIIRINPQKYNELYLKFKNLNRLLAWGHASICEQMIEKTGCSKIVIDQFANESVVREAVEKKGLKPELIQKHRAEEDLVVAAASILARNEFLEGLERLKEQFLMAFPKGASRLVIETGKVFVKRFGKEELIKVGKLHFKTLDSILEKSSE